MFQQLLDNPSARHPAELQAESAKSFPDVVGRSELKLLASCRPITDDAFIIVGVATYAPLELELLDTLHQNAGQWKYRFAIYVFDISACHTFADMHRYLDLFVLGGPWFSWPIHKRMSSIQQTPIILIVKARQVIDFQQGLGPARLVLEGLHVI